MIIDSEKKRFRDTENVEKVIEYDTLWREGEKKLNSLRAEKNKLSKSFKKAKEEGNLEEVIARSKEVAAEIKELTAKNADYLKLRDDYRYKVGNIIDEDVPISDTEDDNVVVRTYGEIPEYDFELLNHVDLINKIDGADLETAASIAGARFYYLKRDILHLNLALIQFALSELEAEGYIPMQTPFFVKGEVAAETSELGEFEETLYKVENEDMYLIATAEQTLAALHRNEIINPDDLPLRYCALSTCFRKEAGSHGKDTLGIFRVHQFEKIEQFIYSAPDDSRNQHDHLMEVTERIYQKDVYCSSNEAVITEVIQKNGIPCNCGNIGCFERYASMKVLKNNLRNALGLDETTRGEQLLDMIRNNSIVNKDYEKIENVVNEFIENLSIGISNLVNLFEPEAVVIGGSFVFFEDVLLERLKKSLKNGKYLFNKREEIVLKPAVLGNDAGIIGASLI